MEGQNVKRYLEYKSLELYTSKIIELIESNKKMGKLIIGDKIFDGTTDVVIKVYNGELI